MAIAGALLCVYLVALAIAFVLVGSIVRNVNRLTRATAAGNAYLKTGTLADVRALAGYVDALNGERYVVVAYINHPNASAAQDAHDALMQWVYKGAP